VSARRLKACGCILLGFEYGVIPLKQSEASCKLCSKRVIPWFHCKGEIYLSSCCGVTPCISCEEVQVCVLGRTRLISAHVKKVCNAVCKCCCVPVLKTRVSRCQQKHWKTQEMLSERHTACLPAVWGSEAWQSQVRDTPVLAL